MLKKKTNKKLVVESWAGAATKISGYVGMTMSLIKQKNYNPDVIVGVSSGAVVGLMRVALMVKPSLIPALDELGRSFTLEDIFDESPLGKKGGLTVKSILRGVRGKLSLAEHKKLSKTLKKFFTKEVYSEYIKGDYPDLLICSTDIDNGNYIIENAKDLSYDGLFSSILASSAIPALMSPLSIINRKIMDGGIRYSNSGWYVIYKLIEEGYEIDSHVSLYSRPKDISNEIDTPLNLSKSVLFRGILGVVGRSISIMMFQNSKFCEFTEQQMSEKYKYNLHQFFLPKILDSALDTDKEQLEELYLSGRDSIKTFVK